MDLGYLRKSGVTAAAKGAVSAADQEAAIRRLAGRRFGQTGSTTQTP